MKKEILIFIIALVFISACEPRDGKQPSANFRTGTQGLILNFVANAPPPVIYDRDAFNVQIEIRNVGASNVGNTGLDKVYLSGFDANIINVQNLASGVSMPRIKGKDQFDANGGTDIVSFQGTINPPPADRFNPAILVTACYGYETIASGNVCVDPNPFTSTAKPKSCIPHGVSLGSQGAPVAVTDVEVESRPQKTNFRINIANVGSGDVFRSDGSYLAKCNPQSQQGLSLFEDINYVMVEDVKLGTESIKASCNPQLNNNHLRLINGRGTLYCSLDIASGSDAYTSTIEVRLKYGYRTTIQRNIEIIKTS